MTRIIEQPKKEYKRITEKQERVVIERDEKGNPLKVIWLKEKEEPKIIHPINLAG